MYRFYFGNLLLPVTPSKLTVKIKGNNKTLTLVNEGEINILRKPGLTDISFDAELPMLGAYPFSSSYQRPDYYLSAFEKLMTSATPFRFIVSRVSPSGALLFDTNMKVSLENYTVTEDAAKGPDVTVSIALKQYVDYTTKTVTVKKAAENSAPVVTTTTTRAGDDHPKGKTHTVVLGDCLWAIAKAYMGSGKRYPELYEANKDLIDDRNKGTGKPKYTIYVGQVLTIP